MFDDVRDQEYKTDQIYDMIFDEFLIDDSPLVRCKQCSNEFLFDEFESNEERFLCCTTFFSEINDSNM